MPSRIFQLQDVSKEPLIVSAVLHSASTLRSLPMFWCCCYQAGLFVCACLTLAPPCTMLQVKKKKKKLGDSGVGGVGGGYTLRPRKTFHATPPPSISPRWAGWISPGQKALWAGHERTINHAASPRGSARRTPPPRMPLSQQAAIPACIASLQRSPLSPLSLTMELHTDCHVDDNKCCYGSNGWWEVERTVSAVCERVICVFYQQRFRVRWSERAQAEVWLSAVRCEFFHCVCVSLFRGALYTVCGVEYEVISPPGFEMCDAVSSPPPLIVWPGAMTTTCSLPLSVSCWP